MQKTIIFGLLIAILMSSVSAYCVCLYDGPCGCDDSDPYRDTNMTQEVMFKPKPQIFWSQSDEALTNGLDMFEDSRPKFSGWEKTIEVEIDSNKACVNENILIRTWYAGKPLENVLVKLYSHGGGRAYISEVTTDENGWAVFGDKAIGKYDFVAKKEGYNFGQKMFSVKNCIPSRKVREAAVEKEKEEDIVAVVYAQEYERRYLQTQIGVRQMATKVRLNAKVDSGDYLIEKIPRSIVDDKSMIGFEQLYPQIFEQNSKEITIGWETGDNSSEIVREYIILQEIKTDTIDDMELVIEKKLDDEQNGGFFESLLAFFGL